MDDPWFGDYRKSLVVRSATLWDRSIRINTSTIMPEFYRPDCSNINRISRHDKIPHATVNDGSRTSIRREYHRTNESETSLKLLRPVQKTDNYKISTHSVFRSTCFLSLSTTFGDSNSQSYFTPLCTSGLSLLLTTDIVALSFWKYCSSVLLYTAFP